MAFDTDELTEISSLLDDLADRRVPLLQRDCAVLQYRVKRHDVLFFEKLRDWQNPDLWIESPIAKFRFNRTRGLWTLLWIDRNFRWHIYDLIPPAKSPHPLVEELDRDPTNIFWG